MVKMLKYTSTIFNLLAVLFLLYSVKAEESCRADGKVVVCYWASWSVYRGGSGYMNVSHIDPSLCTHLVYTFAGLDVIDNKIVSLDPWNDFSANGGQNSYQRFIQLKEQRPCLKTLLAVGGWNEMSKKYSVMAYNPESRKEFATSLVRYLAQYEFDGIDFDWEYPTERGGIAEDNANFIALLRDIKTQLKPWNLLLTVAVAVTKNTVEKAYNIKEMATIVDYISLMAYDYTSPISETTGLLAPLISATGDDIEKSIKLWTDNNCPPEKLVLGIPMYGRSFKLKEPEKCTSKENCGIGTATTTNNLKGKFTKELGFLGSYEVSEQLKKFKYTQVLNQDTQNYFAFNGSYWLSYDNESTIKEKVKFALSKNLGGIMAWSIDTDDFFPMYAKTKYPLLKAINEALDGKY